VSDHPSREELMALTRGRLPASRAKVVLRHLVVENCAGCRGAAPSLLAVLLGMKSARAAPEPAEEAGYEEALSRAFRVALRHGHHLASQRARADQALSALETGGLADIERVARKFRGLGFYEALLTRSWALRHEDPGAMVHLAWLATRAAARLSIRRYGKARVADFQCRAWAELGNAHRTADQLDRAEEAFARAVELYASGTNDASLGVRLLELQAALAADRRRFALASRALATVHDFHRRLGDLHLAGRALISRGLYEGYAGQLEEAVRLLGQGLSLIDQAQDPMLAVAAVHNQVLFLVDAGNFREARIRLFQNRKYLPSNGGRLNELKMQWLEGRIAAGLHQPKLAEQRFRRVKQDLSAAGLGYQAALASLDLAAVLLSQGQAAEAQDLVMKAAGVFAALKIEREAMGAVLLLRQSFEVRATSAGFVQEVAAFLRRIENDPTARFDPQ
jgi:tetratricopeptide (TPR) repeat protein